jgi:hypothetical protein
MDYMLGRIDVLTRFLDDGRSCLATMRPKVSGAEFALARKSWLFASSDVAASAPRLPLILIA